MSQADSSATVTVEDDGLVGFVRPCPPLLGKTTLKNGGGGGGGILCNRNGELGSNANSLSLSLFLKSGGTVDCRQIFHRAKV